MKIEIRTALPSDSVLLSDIGGKTFYETWRPVNTEEDMQTYIKKSFDPKMIKAEIESKTINTFLSAFIERQLIGYVKLRRDRTQENFNNESAIEIERIYVLKEFQDQKAGKALMDRCLEIAMDEKFSWIWLGVNVDNHKAINFYKRYGFTVFGEKSFQLGEAVDKDFLMKRKVNVA